MIGIYDKGLIDSTFIQDVIGYAEYVGVRGRLDDLHNCGIAIAHVSDKDWDSLINKFSCPDSVRVRVSTAGFFDPPPPTLGDNNVYIFHLALPTGNVGAGWKRILSGLSNRKIVKALILGESPERLKRFFVHEVGAYLSALTTLCEGYLAVHALDKTYHTYIRHALSLMKWTEFQNSDSGRELIRWDLGDKMCGVRQQKWWLNVFEQESLYDGVQKEWKDTARTEEIPAELNDLMKVIRNSDTTVSPKIVADAYCVLVKKVVSTPSEWQTRRNKFNHDWLKNRFLNSFDDFIAQLKKSDPDIVRVSEFLAEDFPEWKSCRQDAQWIVESFEDKVSPRQLFDCSPLNRCDDVKQKWLGNLVHTLWLFRFPVRKKAKESQEILASVNELYEKIAYELEQSRPIQLTQLIVLCSQFCELRETYENLSKSLSNLPRRESYDG